MVILGILIIPSVLAAETPAHKFGRGLANAATGWVELPRQIYLVSSETDPLTGLIYGTIKGVSYSVLRTGSGAYDVASFVIPPYDRPLLNPEFVFEGW